MDYGGIIKKAWHVTWRYRVLWIFGFFAGAAGGGGGGGGGSNYSQDMSGDQFDTSQFDRALEWMSDNAVLLIGAITLLVLIGLALWIISVAARGGLIYLVNEAEEGRPVRARDGWGVGFSKWGRVFVIDLVLYLPLIIILVITAVAAFVPLIAAADSGGDPTAGIFSVCGAFIFGGLILIVLGFVIGLLEAMAIRHGVLDDMPAMTSISTAWSDLRSRFKDLFVMWLITVAIGLGFGMVIAIIAGIFGVAIALAVVGGAWPVAILIGFVLFLALLLPQAIFGTFSSAIWTIFFRYMTGRQGPAGLDAVGAQAQYGYQPVPPPPAPGEGYRPIPAPPAQGGQMPAPPAAYPPPAPPADYPPPPPPAPAADYPPAAPASEDYPPPPPPAPPAAAPASEDYPPPPPPES